MAMARQDFSVETAEYSRTNAQSNLFSALMWKIYIYIIDLVNKITPSPLVKINIYATDITRALLIKKFKRIPKIIRHDENKSKISINILNEDCLRHIFSYLPLKDMLTVGSVSRKWNEIIETSVLPKITDLSYNTVQERLSFSDLKKILNRCGKQFRYVDFDICDDYRLSRTIEMVGEKCNNLQSVNITRYKLSEREILNFYPFVELPKITVGNNSEWTLVFLLIFMKNLTHLTIRNYQLLGTHYIYRSLTADVIPDMRKLRHLSISECISISDSPFILNSPTITSLRLNNNNPPIKINKMPNLCSLDVSSCKNLNDVLLDEICKKCKNLTELNISHCTGISDAALSSLICLRNLKHLKMNGLLNITDPKVNNLKNLKILECKGCINLHNAGLFALINASLSLELLDLSSCRCITHDLINRIICLWKKAICFNVLTIHISGTNVDKNSLIEFMPFVRLCDTPYIIVDKSLKDDIPTGIKL